LSWVGKGQAILVFSAFGFSVGKNQMCLTERWLFTLTHNGLRVAAVGDFGALHCQPAQKFDSSTKLQVYTSPPIEATRCWR